MLSYLMSFLGGGLVAAILNWLRVARSERRALKAARIREQLEKLYGPLFFVTSQAKKLHELSRRHSDAYRVKYIESQFGSREDWDSAIQVGNCYATELHNLAKEATKIMQNAYSHIEPKDSSVFQDVVIDALRLAVEREESGKIKVPIEIYQCVGNMYFFRENFIELVEIRFNEMRNELVRLERLS
ncbi:hypothetical protein [Aeromonas dhakensis]|uniref:hypothetical protein n=1 Tax=Aeromonas dhakensis TaxID=196024 RepID=UPI00191E1B0A|nr:hypothetical protein [Aeromonas dhakensis]MBL0677609.1 hypothetical protein [Aeromonas dhakensis]WAF99186.1 hypothetical protein NRZ31_00020 [Aeromonas dhakensis]